MTGVDNISLIKTENQEDYPKLTASRKRLRSISKAASLGLSPLEIAEELGIPAQDVEKILEHPTVIALTLHEKSKELAVFSATAGADRLMEIVKTGKPQEAIRAMNLLLTWIEKAQPKDSEDEEDSDPIADIEDAIARAG